MSPTSSNDRKRKLSSMEGDSSFQRRDSHSSQALQPSQPKLLKLERCKSSTKISFDDTINIDRGNKIVQGEPDSSDEEEGADRHVRMCAENKKPLLSYFPRYRVEIIPGLSEPVIAPTPALQPTSRIDRRKMFARSKSVKTCYSMPVPVSITILRQEHQDKLISVKYLSRNYPFKYLYAGYVSSHCLVKRWTAVFG